MTIEISGESRVQVTMGGEVVFDGSPRELEIVLRDHTKFMDYIDSQEGEDD